MASLSEIETLAQKHFGITAKAKKLDGEVDLNFRLSTEANERYTFKWSSKDASEQELRFQSSIIDHINKKELPFNIPAVITSKSQEKYIPLNNGTFIRLHKWVDGRVLADVHPRSESILQQWGQTVAHLSKALEDFQDPYAKRFYKWNPSETLSSRKHAIYFETVEQKEIAEFFWVYFEKTTQAKLSNLRKSINYMDAHEYNLLCNEDKEHPRITGVIDFGDALYTETVNDLAVACAYAAMGLQDPLDAFKTLVGTYHQVFPLQEDELEVLFSMISARLLITVATAAHNRHLNPDNAYLSISEKPAWALLKKMRFINPDWAHYTFREACGFEPFGKRKIWDSWYKEHAIELGDLIPMENKKAIELDLSVQSIMLGNNAVFDDSQKYTKRIKRILEDQQAQVGYGGYGEVRPFYSSDAYVYEGSNGPEWRTVHLGLDLWDLEGTPVKAAWEGNLYGVFNNEGDCNYGPTIILEHSIDDDQKFYTLYGHLSLESLEHKKMGQAFSAGEVIGYFGTREVNGNWPPHLHFQIILDMLGNRSDFPGVGFPKDRKIWSSLCPGIILDKHSPRKEELNAQQLIQKRKKILGPNLSLSYKKPIHMVRGYKQYLYDADARRYLDTCNNVPHVGHQHPRIVEAAQKQLAVLNTNTRYVHKNIIEFAENLLSTFPDELSVAFFVNSGSEANELALRMARTYTGEKDMLAIEVGYHGNTSAVVDVSSYKFDGKGGEGAPEHTHLIPMPNTYRGLYKDLAKAGKQYADHIPALIQNLKSEGRNIAGFICESILSCGGQIVLPPDFLKYAFKHVRQAGGLCIMDEVQVGLGRVGEQYWAYELQEVIPDIVTIGKPLGNGHPLAAVVCRREVAEAFANGMEYFNTFGGNPVSCAIGNEVLKVVKEEGLQENARQVGHFLKAGLMQLQKQHPIISDVRGHGFFLGFEMVKNRETFEAAEAQCSYLANRLRERGVLASTDGPLHNVIKIKPPMCFTKKNAEYLLEELDLVMKEDFMLIS